MTDTNFLHTPSLPLNNHFSTFNQNFQKKSCIEAGFAEKQDDSEDLKEAKNELKTFFTENTDAGFYTLENIFEKTIEEMENDQLGTFESFDEMLSCVRELTAFSDEITKRYT